jgi:putrescine aminotransferase
MLTPDTAREDALRLYRKHVNAGMARIMGLASSPLETRSEGLYVYDEHDTMFLDCGGYCVFLLGHRHPVVHEAVVAQLEKYSLATRTLIDPVLAQAAAAMSDAVPDGLDYIWFGTSGAEVVETALKLARLAGCENIVSADGGFHGKTLGALSVCGRPRLRTPFEPLLPHVTRVPYGDAEALDCVIRKIRTRCAVILEPIQAEAGVVIPPRGYMRAARKICDAHDALLIVDEISTGLGRTGRRWCIEYDGVRPDVLVAGKALGGGVVPASAVATTPELFAPLNRDPLLHSSTFAGNPLAAAAIVATLKVVEGDDIPAVADKVGARLLVKVRAITSEYTPEIITEVRGRGLLLGLDMAQEHFAAELMLELLDRHVIVAHSLNAQCVVRLTPPAGFDETATEWLLAALAEALDTIARRYKSDYLCRSRRAS